MEIVDIQISKLSTHPNMRILRKRVALILATLTLLSTSVYAVEPIESTDKLDQPELVGGGSIENLNTSDVPVTLNAEPAKFSVTVPTTLPVWVDSSGNVEVATNAQIVNNSSGPVKVTSLKIESTNDWVTKEFSKDLSKSKVGSKEYSLEVNGDRTTSSGIIQFNQSNWGAIEVGASQSVIYNTKISPQKESINQSIANLVITVDWDSKPLVEVISLTSAEAKALGFLFKEKSDGTIRLGSGSNTKGYTGDASNLILPSYIDGKQVTELGMFTLSGNPYIENLYIPDSITVISERAVQSCDKLKNVVMSNSVTSIGTSAFDRCRMLETINIPVNLSYLGSSAFHNCNSLKSINIPGSIGKILDYTFQYCGASTITIGEGITSIGYQAFYGCPNIEYLVIPNSVDDVGGSCFTNCKALKQIKLPDKLGVINGGMFDGCTELKNIQIPDTVKTIYGLAFGSCASLDVDIPETVSKIEYRAFYNVPHITYNGKASGSPWGALKMN